MGIEPTLPQLTEKGQSFNEHGYQAGAFISANFNSFVQNIVKSQIFGNIRYLADMPLICQCLMFRRKV